MNIVISKLPEEKKKRIEKAKRQLKRDLEQMGWHTLDTKINENGEIKLEMQTMCGSIKGSVEKILIEKNDDNLKITWQEYLEWVGTIEETTGICEDARIGFLFSVKRKS